MRNGCVQYGCVQYGSVRPQIGFTHRSIEAYNSIEKFVSRRCEQSESGLESGIWRMIDSIEKFVCDAIADTRH